MMGCMLILRKEVYCAFRWDWWVYLYIVYEHGMESCNLDRLNCSSDLTMVVFLTLYAPRRYCWDGLGNKKCTMHHSLTPYKLITYSFPLSPD
jgi:hypothetical protein